MTDRLADLEERVKRLSTALDEQTEAKLQAYDELGERDREVRALERELVAANGLYAQEASRATNSDIEAGLYRERYYRALARMGATSRSVLVAKAARDYLAAIEGRGSLEDGVVAALEQLAEQVRAASPNAPDPQHDLIIELESELETLRARVVALQDERDVLGAQVEDLNGHAADWQELAEATDRQLVEAQGKLKLWEQWPGEVRHVLGHVAGCEDNCDQCRRMAKEALDWNLWGPGD